jgi:hypothetical protein
MDRQRAVKPAVPSVIASNAVMLSGRRTIQSPGTRTSSALAAVVRDAEVVAGYDDLVTALPARVVRSVDRAAVSMPATVGYLRMMRPVPLYESASL